MIELNKYCRGAASISICRQKNGITAEKGQVAEAFAGPVIPRKAGPLQNMPRSVTQVESYAKNREPLFAVLFLCKKRTFGCFGG